MNTHTKQPSHVNSGPSQKYSLRQHLFHERSFKSKTPLISIASNKNSQANDTAVKSYGVPPYNNNSNLSSFQQRHFDNNKYNCFDVSRRDAKVVMGAPFKVHGGYRTLSTNFEGQNRHISGTNLQRSVTSSEGIVKLSLRTHQRNVVSKTSSRIVMGYGVEGRHKTQMSYTNPNDYNITEQKNSDHDNSKYSLKTSRTKPKKPEVLISLKYEDLASPIQHPLSSKTTRQPFLTNFYQILESNTFCTINKGNDLGCKCRPKCYWAKSWIQIIGAIPNERPHRIKNQSQYEANLKQIQKDLQRTQPDHPSFQSQQMLQMLKQILIGYAQIDEEVGYVQGMNFVAAALLYHTYSVEDSIKILIYMMKVCGYRKLFLNKLQLGNNIASQMSEEVRKLVFDLYSHLTEEGMDLNMFVSSWYFSLCGSFVPLDSMHHFIDKFIKKGFAGINQLIITLLLKKKEDLMELEDSQLMLQFSNKQLYDYGETVNWLDLRKKSDNLMLNQIRI